MKQAKTLQIVGELSDTKLIVEVVEQDRLDIPSFGIIHDYIAFQNIEMLSTGGDYRHETLKNKHASCANGLFYSAQVQISIREFGEVILPALNNCKELTPEHFRHYDKGGGTRTAIRYYDDSKKQHMVAFRMKGSDVYDHVTEGCFTAMVKAGLIEG